ncbi:MULTISPECIES: fimbrial protein [Pseudomonas]|jgi:hypothetical protein|uniref:Fimbrial protein n=1 Tax=Pseudomonas kulmbachensis TaxID=3043408 RepID=A0ABW7LYI1_9PSED|nr:MULTISPECIES: fimbrial protein [Pseudomonas]UXL39448.1 fimbrial protein [Pseudomonas fragi]
MHRTFMATVSPLALALLATLGATHVSAADPVDVQIQLIASIPSDNFYVVPAETGWISVPQRMEWTPNMGTGYGQLSTLRKAFDVKNSSGAIAARLTDAGGPYLSSGTDVVPLYVHINNKELTATSQEFINATEAAAGKRVDLTIAAADIGRDYAPGEYSAIVNMTFDAVAPVTP